MIGKADIEGSKSNVAMNAWLPQANYPCGNFSDTSSFKFRRTKGSIGHAFTTNSPPDNVFRPDRPTEVDLGSKKRGNAPPPIHGIVLSRLFDARGRGPEGPVPNPSPDRHATTRSRRESSSSSPPTADGFGTGTPVPSPHSQYFSRGYGSILPTALAYIVPSTRGCSPRRPDAIMSTTKRGRHSVLRIFKGRQGRTGQHATCGALPAAGPYLRLSCFQGGQAICTDDRSARAHALGFAAITAPSYSSRLGTCPDGWVTTKFGTVTQLPVHPASPVLLTKNGTLGALDSMAWLNRAAVPSYLFKNSPAGSSYPEGNFGGNQLLDGSVGGATHKGIPPISFLAPYEFTHPLTRTHVRLLGPCFKTGRMGSPQADARSTHVPRHAMRRALPFTIAMMSPRAFQQPGLGPPSQSASINASSRSVDRLSPFHIRPRHIVGPHPLPSRQFQALFDSLFKGPGTTGLSPSLVPPSRGLGPGPPLRTLLQTTIRTPKAIDSHDGLFPVHSPVSKSALNLMASGATCVQRLDGSRDSAIHTKYRISLRSSSMQEPTYPLFTYGNLVTTSPSVGSVDFTPRRRQRTAHIAAIRTLHRTIQSVGATGGVYKGQGRSQRKLMTRAY
ncbi:hypothetical protein DEO72_LG11g1748 [Vigna unguiculata]|uniref:Senescence-associated protein n=1 Tax=Vigna unguiculata TaxID=3917 RepID=A0A4D6NLR0_VIGUN|nr:hypothetical protein DEO72_LG11g1748 [Vigna unguiculata]